MFAVDVFKPRNVCPHSPRLDETGTRRVERLFLHCPQPARRKTAFAQPSTPKLGGTLKNAHIAPRLRTRRAEWSILSSFGPGGPSGRIMSRTNNEHASS